MQTETEHLTNNAPGLVDFRNNVIYNWLGMAGYGSAGEPGNVNLVNNYYKVGPGGDTGTHTSDPSIVHSNGGTQVFVGSSSTQVFQSGNVRANLNGTTTNLANSDFGPSVFQGSTNSVPYVGTTLGASAAYTQVLAYVGANWNSRGSIDTRLISDVINGTGQITAFDDPQHGYNSAGVYTNYATATSANDTEWNKILAARSTTNIGTDGTPGNGATGQFTRPANYDTDGDGMPDIWELAHNLNPLVADNNGDYENNGYTNLEKYLNELAAFPADSTLVFKGGTNRYALIGNWGSGVFLPSRYDQAQVNSGTAVVDCIGEHAGTLKIAANAGNSAALSVTSGWIDIDAQALNVGLAGNGQANQNRRHRPREYIHRSRQQHRHRNLRTLRRHTQHTNAFEVGQQLNLHLYRRHASRQRHSVRSHQQRRHPRPRQRRQPRTHRRRRDAGPHEHYRTRRR